MATLVTYTVKPSPVGPNEFSSLSLAVGAIPADIVATDEEYVINCDDFGSGQNDGFDFPSITTDATHTIVIQASPGAEYVRSTNTGFYLEATRNFDGVITNTGTAFLTLQNIGLKNLGTSSARGITNSTSDCSLIHLYATTASTNDVFNITGGERYVIDNNLAEGGGTGFAFGAFVGGDATNNTAIDTANGYSKSGANRPLTLKNSLYLGAGAFLTGTNNFTASSDYNASSDTTAIGANALQNRTTGDLVDYANNDYRTASGSVLATAGEGGTFIGFDVETAAGISASITEEYQDFDETINVQVSIQSEITESYEDFSEGINVNFTSQTTATITESYDSFDESVDVLFLNPVSSTITESYSDFNDSISISFGQAITIDVTEQYNDFTESVNASFAQVTERKSLFSRACRIVSKNRNKAYNFPVITESYDNFDETVVVTFTSNIIINPKNIFRTKRKNSTMRVKRTNNTIRVK